MSKITLNPTTINDWKTIQNLEKQAEGKHYPAYTQEKDIKKYLSSSQVFLINHNDKPIGSISYEIKNDKTIYFDGFTILPEYRNQGFATQALTQIIQQLKNKTHFTLAVHPENTPALLIYLKANFKIKQWKNDYFGDGEPRLILEKFRTERSKSVPLFSHPLHTLFSHSLLHPHHIPQSQPQSRRQQNNPTP